MTRQIKFKIWDKESSEWYEPTHEAYKGNLEYLVIGLSGDLSMMKDGQMYHQSTFPNRFEKVQFTGLLDKNGKPIYEGDVVKSLGTGDVRFGYYSAGGMDYYASSAYGFYIQQSEFEDDTETLNSNCEIIGNIYEHPHLLTSEVN